MSKTFISDLPPLTSDDFQRISRLAYKCAGLNLGEGKEGLVASRLGRTMRQGNFSSFAEYYRHVVADSTGESLIQLIDALTTNHTSFLREPAHFDFLRGAGTGQLREADSIRVWSAACSSGEEPYSIAMTLLDASPGCRWSNNIQIIASDISTRVLQEAREAIYESDAFSCLNENWRRSYVLKGIGSKTGSCKVKPAVTGLVQFERLNLIELLPRRTFDFIFCRNVMIYFDAATREDLVQRMAQCLDPGGYLFIGHSESLNGTRHPLRYVKPAVYRKE